MVDGADIESQSLSIDTIKRREYQRLSDKYKPVFEGTVSNEIEFAETDETLQMLRSIPESDRDRIRKFSTRVSTIIPDEVFSKKDLRPINRQGLKALIANSYLVDTDAHTDISTKEMYIRALSALSGDSLYFSAGYESNTEEVIEHFFEGDFTQEAFSNFMSQLNAQTMPISNGWEDKQVEDKKAFDMFFEKIQGRYCSAMDVFIEYCKKYAPHRVADAISWKDNLVFVETISRVPLFSNDPELESDSKYNVLFAGAVAFGIDPVSGLPLTVTHRPYNFDDIYKGVELAPKDDPAYKESLTLVHENLHNVTPERIFSGDFMHLVNELLTDSSSWIINLKAEGYDLLNCPDDHLAFTGYFDLVLLARNLVKNEFFTEDELVELGMSQDPKRFLDTLNQRVAECEHEGKVADVLTFLRKRLLIKPIKEDQVPAKLEQFKTCPSLFLQNECMEMWELVGGQYMGTKWFISSIFDDYRAAHPEVGEKDYGAIRNENGALNDEAVDLFYKHQENKKPYRSMLLSEDKFIQQMNETDPDTNLHDLEVPEHLTIPDDNDGLLMSVFNSANSILQEGLDYHVSDWSDSQRFNAVVSASRELYQGIVKILETNWTANGVDYNRDDVLRFLQDIIPSWQRYDKTVREPQELIRKILSGVDGLTKPVETPNGKSIFGPEQVFYWGSALEVF